MIGRRELLGGMGGALTATGRATVKGAEKDDLPYRNLRTSFGDIAYRAAGGGPAAAVFLHGFPLSSYQWRDVIRGLSGGAYCLAPDFMGLGETEISVTQPIGPMDQARMIIEVLDRKGIKSAHVVANDSGGAVAQLIAAHYPDRVDSLLLTNCDCEADCPPQALQPVFDLARENRYAQAWLVPWFNDPDLARSAAGLGGICYSRPENPTNDAVKAYLGPLVRKEARLERTNRFALSLTSNALAGLESALKRLRAPVRIVWGAADSIFSPDTPGYLNGVFQQARGVRTLAEAKLFFPEEYPHIVVGEARALWGVARLGL